jgi:hypothetical protein
MRRNKNLLGLFRLIPNTKFKLSPYKKQTSFVFMETIVFAAETEFVLCEVKLNFSYDQALSQN